MDKPKIKCEVVVSGVYEKAKAIYFYASNEAASEFGSFGDLGSAPLGQWRLFVDHRFDFDEVVEYIRNYENL